MEYTIQTDATPPGYRVNPLGHLVPESAIDEIDRMRDGLVQELVHAALSMQETMREFKRRAFNDTNAFISLAADKYHVKLGGAKGNVTLYSFDASHKVVIRRAENISFDEGLQAAKALVDECIIEWSRGSDPKIQALVQQAFETDKEGKINVGRVLALRTLKIDDEKWRRAMDAISDSVRVIGTKAYIQFFVRDKESGKYLPIPLDFAAL